MPIAASPDGRGWPRRERPTVPPTRGRMPLWSSWPTTSWPPRPWPSAWPRPSEPISTTRCCRAWPRSRARSTAVRASWPTSCSAGPSATAPRRRSTTRCVSSGCSRASDTPSTRAGTRGFARCWHLTEPLLSEDAAPSCTRWSAWRQCTTCHRRTATCAWPRSSWGTGHAARRRPHDLHGRPARRAGRRTTSRSWPSNRCGSAPGPSTALRLTVHGRPSLGQRSPARRRSAEGCPPSVDGVPHAPGGQRHRHDRARPAGPPTPSCPLRR